MHQNRNSLGNSSTNFCSCEFSQSGIRSIIPTPHGAVIVTLFLYYITIFTPRQKPCLQTSQGFYIRVGFRSQLHRDLSTYWVCWTPAQHENGLVLKSSQDARDNSSNSTWRCFSFSSWSSGWKRSESKGHVIKVSWHQSTNHLPVQHSCILNTSKKTQTEQNQDQNPSVLMSSLLSELVEHHGNCSLLLTADCEFR